MLPEVPDDYSVLAPPSFVTLGDSPESFVTQLGGYILWIPAMLAALALLAYAWGLIEFLGANLKESEKHAGRIYMSWGGLILAILFFVWIVVYFVVGFFSSNSATL